MKQPPVPFQRFLDANRDAVWRLLVAVAGRAEAEDCFQETFMAALKAYPKLRDENPRAWVLTIAHNKAMDAHRSRARRPQPSEDVDLVIERRAASAAPSAPRDDELWEAVHALPERQRAAVILRHCADLPHREIAAVIGCSPEAARRSLHEGLRHLREAMN